MLRAARTISASDREEERAHILSERAQTAGRHGRFREAEAALGQLEIMVKEIPSAALQHALDGAQGAVLLYQGKHEEAIPVLERNHDDQFSLFRLAYAAQKSGNEELAKARLSELSGSTSPRRSKLFSRRF